MNMSADFSKKFRVKELKIHENVSWVLSLRPNQPTLGSCILSSKKQASSLSDLAPEDGADLISISRFAESALNNRFKCARVNYYLLMHFDNHLHFHLIPRYPDSVMFAGGKWEDTGWPGFPDNMAPGEGAVEPAILEEILNTLKGFSL